MAFCQNCGKELAEGAKFCDSCGKPVGAAAEDGTKRSQKFIAGGVQYKCPNCGAIVSRTTTKCPECGYKIDFKENSKSVAELRKLLKDKEADIPTVIATYDFPLEAQEMLELAIFASQKAVRPVSEFDDDRLEESHEWLGLLERIEEKAALMTENKDIAEEISTLKNKAKEKQQRLVEKHKKEERKSNFGCLLMALSVLVPILVIAFLWGFFDGPLKIKIVVSIVSVPLSIIALYASGILFA